MARNAEPASPLVPWQITDNATLILSVNLYDTLLRTTKDGLSIEPGLATKWEPSADNLTWTFTIQEGVRFADGTPLRGADIKASLDQCIKSKKSAWKSLFGAIKEVQIPDDTLVKILLYQPHAPILSELALFCTAILPAQMAMDSDNEGFDATQSNGTGAYVLNGWHMGDPLVLRRNPYYWKSTPSLDVVHIEYIPDDNGRILKLQSGDTDVIDSVPFSQLQTLSQQPNIKARAFAVQRFDGLVLNTEVKPLDDIYVRQALNYALDKDAIVKAAYMGNAKPMTAPIPPGTYWDKALRGYPFSLDKAKQLMASSTSPEGFTIAYTIPLGDTTAQMIAAIAKDQWTEIGVNIMVQEIDRNICRQDYRAGKFAITTIGWTNDMNDPMEAVGYEIQDNGSPLAARTGLAGPDLSIMTIQAYEEQDAKKRETDYAIIQRIYLEQAPLVFIAYPHVAAAWHKSVDGFAIDGLSYHRFEDVSITK